MDLLVQLPALYKDQPVHGDFNDKQILLSENAVTILDLDEAMAGDPVYDLGLFIAHLERYALVGDLGPGQVERLSEALLDGYGQVTRKPLPAHVELYTAFGLVQLAVEPFRILVPDWPAKIEAVLARADACLGRLAPARVVFRPGVQAGA